VLDDDFARWVWRGLERHGIGKREALLTKASRDHNIELRELARRLVETGEVPQAV
jgi:hypothetical protein